jgi:hypothetical protein
LLTKGTNSDLWRTCTKNENTATLENTTTGYTDATTYSITCSASNVVFGVNGTTVETHTTNVPDEEMFLLINIGQAGNPGTLFNVYVDYVEVSQDE